MKDGAAEDTESRLVAREGLQRVSQQDVSEGRSAEGSEGRVVLEVPRQACAA